ncbi:MAG: OmpA family protein [Fibrobacteria bacterium]|nr:OmpA family protein [Fibrobacteria bacterium]
MIKSCSLYVETAVKQLHVLEYRIKTRSLQATKDSVLNKLADTYKMINSIERGYSTNLKQNLKLEKQKALKRQEEARTKFQMLQSDFINVKKDARGIILSMSDILFDVGKASLTQELKTNLAKIAGILFVYKEASIIVEGHTDSTGSEEFNQKLSERRAIRVMDFLIEQDIDKNRLKAAGYGFSKPVAENATEEGRQKNRRVDLIVSEPNPSP